MRKEITELYALWEEWFSGWGRRGISSPYSNPKCVEKSGLFAFLQWWVESNLERSTLTFSWGFCAIVLERKRKFLKKSWENFLSVFRERKTRERIISWEWMEEWEFWV